MDQKVLLSSLLIVAIAVTGASQGLLARTQGPGFSAGILASDVCADLAGEIAPGAVVTPLACVEGLRHRNQLVLTLTWEHLPGRSTSPVRKRYGDELLYVVSGEVIVVDAVRREEVALRQGEHLFMGPDPDAFDDVEFGLRNARANQGVSVLRLHWSEAPAAAAGSAVTVPQWGQSQLRDLLTFATYEPDPPRSVDPYDASTWQLWNDRIFLAQLSLEPGAQIDYHTHAGVHAFVVESGTLTYQHQLPDRTDIYPDFEDWVGEQVPAGENKSIGPGEFIVIPQGTPHMEWNSEETPVNLLVFGAVRADEPFTTHVSTIEVHAAACPPEYENGQHFQDCHDQGVRDAAFLLEGPDGFQESASTVRGREGTGPGLLTYHDLRSGEYLLSHINSDPSDLAAVSCNDVSGQSLSAPHSGQATDPAAVQVPTVSYVVCDWFIVPQTE